MNIQSIQVASELNVKHANEGGIIWKQGIAIVFNEER